MLVSHDWHDLVLSNEFCRRQLDFLREQHPGLPLLPESAWTYRGPAGVSEKQKRSWLVRSFARILPYLEMRMKRVESDARQSPYGELFGAFSELRVKLFRPSDSLENGRLGWAVFDPMTLERFAVGGDTRSPQFWLGKERLLFLFEEPEELGAITDIQHRVVLICALSVSDLGKVQIMTKEVAPGSGHVAWTSVPDWGPDGQVTGGCEHLRQHFGSGWSEERWQQSLLYKLGRRRDGLEFYGPFLGRLFG